MRNGARRGFFIQYYCGAVFCRFIYRLLLTECGSAVCDPQKGLVNIMLKTGKVALIGGDLRSLVAAGHLRSIGMEARLYGFGEDSSRARTRRTLSDSAVDSLCCSSCAAAMNELSPYIERVLDSDMMSASLDDALKDCAAVILPLPFSQNGTTVSMPFSDAVLRLDKLIDEMNAHGVHQLCGGKLSEDFCAECRNAGIDVFDYYSREEFAIANAIPTAEGAIAIAMNELAITLDGAKALVIGYGRIGKVLSNRLAALNAETVVTARKPEDLAWIRAAGLRAEETGELRELLYGYHPDVIFNTVPHCVLGRDELERIRKGELIIDLASKPGGVDISAAGALGHKVIWALSLPGKVAPVTSGKIIANTILSYFKEQKED